MLGKEYFTIDHLRPLRPDQALRRCIRSAALHAEWQREVEQARRGKAITLAWLNHCLREVVGPETIVISAYSFRQEYCPLPGPGQQPRAALVGRHHHADRPRKDVNCATGEVPGPGG
jgi:hypothetical protein